MPKNSINQIYIEKIKNLEIHFEIKICDVTLMSFEKFKSNKKWNSSKFTNKIGNDFLNKWWGDCKAVAILPFSGDYEEHYNDLKYKVQESLELLAFSAYPNNMDTRIFQLGEMNNWSTSNTVNIYIKKSVKYNTSSKFGAITFKLNQTWMKDAKKYKYLDLLKLLSNIKKPKYYTIDWKNNIKEVCKIIGKTNISSDYKNGFLMCMIALEMLLLTNDDKQKSKPLIQRLESLFGWHIKWNEEQWHEKIAKLYTKRNGIVHSGNFTKVEYEDYYFARELCVNLINNLVIHQKYFYDKDALILFTEKIRAEKLLGFKNKTKPTNISYIRLFTGESLTDLDEIQNII